MTTEINVSPGYFAELRQQDRDHKDLGFAPTNLVSEYELNRDGSYRVRLDAGQSDNPRLETYTNIEIDEEFGDLKSANRFKVTDLGKNGTHVEKRLFGQTDTVWPQRYNEVTDDITLLDESFCGTGSDVLDTSEMSDGKILSVQNKRKGFLGLW